MLDATEAKRDFPLKPGTLHFTEQHLNHNIHLFHLLFKEQPGLEAAKRTLETELMALFLHGTWWTLLSQDPKKLLPVH